MPVSRWFPISIAQTQIAGGFTIVLTTDIACHLWLFWTEKEPWFHRISKIVRGLAVPWDAYWCFVAWHLIEQNEPGDTITHTFTWTGWETCQTKWFRFHGEIASVTSPSDSPIFSKHYLYIPPSEIVVPPFEPYENISNQWWTLQPFIAPNNNAPTTVKIWLWVFAATPSSVEVFVEEAFIAGGYIQFYIDQTGHIMGSGSISAAELNTHIGQYFQYTVSLSGSSPLTQGQPYGVSRYNLHPWQLGIYSQRGVNAPDKLYTLNYALNKSYTNRNLFLYPQDDWRAAFSVIF